MNGVQGRRRHTLPPMAVPSALIGLTSLFGMGRGEPYCYNHLNCRNVLALLNVLTHQKDANNKFV